MAGSEIAVGARLRNDHLARALLRLGATAPRWLALPLARVAARVFFAEYRIDGGRWQRLDGVVLEVSKE